MNTMYADALKNNKIAYQNGEYSARALWDKMAQSLYASCDIEATGNQDDHSLQYWYNALFGEFETARYADDSKNAIFYSLNKTNNASQRVWSDKTSDAESFKIEHAINRSDLKVDFAAEDVAAGIANEMLAYLEGITKHTHDADDLIDMNGEESDGEGIEGLAKALADKGIDNNGGPILYTVNSVLAEHGNNGIASNQQLTWGTIFYDFSIEQLDIPFNSAMNALEVNEDTEGAIELYEYLQDRIENGDGDAPGITYDISSGKPEYSVGTINYSTAPVDMSVAYGTSASESATNTRSHTKDNDVNNETTLIFAGFGDSEGATFDNRYAPLNLHNRFENRDDSTYEEMYGDKLNWSDITGNDYCKTTNNKPDSVYRTDLPALVDALYRYQPYSVTGGNLDARVSSTNTSIYDLEPLYDLARVRTEEAYDYDMKTGESLYVDNIPLIGENSAGVEFYGFSPDKGSWSLVDAQGQALTDSSVAYLSEDPITGNTALVANGPGSVYLKYNVRGNAYEDANGDDRVSENLTTAAIKINVTTMPFGGGVQAEAVVSGGSGSGGGSGGGNTTEEVPI